MKAVPTITYWVACPTAPEREQLRTHAKAWCDTESEGCVL
jgi:hypothetical protein